MDYYSGSQFKKDHEGNLNFLREFYPNKEEMHEEIDIERSCFNLSLLASKGMPAFWQVGGIWGLMTNKNLALSAGLIIMGEATRALLHLYRTRNVQPYINKAKRDLTQMAEEIDLQPGQRISKKIYNP